MGIPGTRFVVVGMHPFFFMTGMPTHFKDSDGHPKAIETYVHLVHDDQLAVLAYCKCCSYDSGVTSASTSSHTQSR